jgi:hypothetical protein
MRNIYFIILLIANGLFCQAQRIPNPKISARSSSARAVQINYVEIAQNQTIISLTVYQPKGTTLLIPSETYIVPSEGGEKLMLQKANGISIDKNVRMKRKGRISFQLVFPKIGNTVKKIDYRGGDKDTGWYFFEISTNPNISEPHNVALPEKAIITRNGETVRSITYPRYAAKSVDGFDIYKIELTDTATILYFEVLQRGGWVFVPVKSSIQSSDGGNVLYVRSAEGIRIGQKINLESSGKIFYKLIFPKIDDDVKKINFRELNEGGNWSVFELEIDMD